MLTAFQPTSVDRGSEVHGCFVHKQALNIVVLGPFLARSAKCQLGYGHLGRSGDSGLVWEDHKHSHAQPLRHETVPGLDTSRFAAPGVAAADPVSKGQNHNHRRRVLRTVFPLEPDNTYHRIRGASA